MAWEQPEATAWMVWEMEWVEQGGLEAEAILE